MRFKSMVWLLILLISTQSIFSGCTAIGYDIGRDKDIHNAPAKPCQLSDIVSGDFVKIELKSGEIIKGEIKEIKSGEYLIIRCLYLKDNANNYERKKTVIWDHIVTVNQLDVGIKKRITGISVGLLLDLILVSIYMIGMAMSGIGTMA